MWWKLQELRVHAKRKCDFRTTAIEHNFKDTKDPKCPYVQH